MQFSRYVKHSIPKYTPDETEAYPRSRDGYVYAHLVGGHEQHIESCAWLNTIAASLCVEALSSPVLVESLHKKLHDILNKAEDKPDVLGKIVISDINMGTGLPMVDGIRVLSRAHDDTLNAEVALRYNGGASFTISTELWINWPTPKFASLPVSLHASFDHFEGTLTAVCRWYSTYKQRVALYFRAPPKVQLRIGSTIGHTTKLVNVLQVSTMLENMILSFVNKELVAPCGFELDLEEGKVVAVRKLSAPGIPSVPKIKAAGEKEKERERERESAKQQHQHQHGDLSRRSFSVSATS